MTTKSVSQQIIDEFIAELSKTKILEKPRLDLLQLLLSSEKIKKNDITKLLEKEEGSENPFKGIGIKNGYFRKRDNDVA